MNGVFQFAAVAAFVTLLLGATTVNAANPDVKVDNFEFDKDSNDTKVHVNIVVKYKPPGAGDIVFLYYSVGGQPPKLIANGTSGKVDVIVDVKKTVEEMRKMPGNNPVSLMVYACDVYTEAQALYWIAHNTVNATKAGEIYASGD